MTPLRLSALNLATQRRYEACLRDGGHIPSGAVVTRDIGRISAALSVCESCLVPYSNKALATYNGRVMSNGRPVVVA